MQVLRKLFILLVSLCIIKAYDHWMVFNVTELGYITCCHEHHFFQQPFSFPYQSRQAQYLSLLLALFIRLKMKNAYDSFQDLSPFHICYVFFLFSRSYSTQPHILFPPAVVIKLYILVPECSKA